MADDLILVDEHDRGIGTDSKVNCHLGMGKLHRAFSLFLFNEAGDLLIQQRCQDKPLWPGFWANSCCSHPRVGENITKAAMRRAHEELGVTIDEPTWLFKFQYHAQFGEIGSEHELCHVLIASLRGPVLANPSEIAAWRWIRPEALTHELVETPEKYTPWLHHEWPRLMRDFTEKITSLNLTNTPA